MTLSINSHGICDINMAEGTTKATKDNDYLSILPVELLTHVLSFLNPTKEVDGAVKQVSKTLW